MVILIVTDRIHGNGSTIVVGRGVAVAVTVEAGVEVVDAVTAGADQQHRTSKRKVVLAVAAAPEEVGLGAGTSRKEVDHAHAARTGIADLAVARNPRETDQTVARSAREVVRIVVADQRRVGQGVTRSLEAMRIVRVILRARKKLPEVVPPVSRSRTKVDREVPRVLRKAALVVMTNRNSLTRMAERVAVVRQVLVKKPSVEVVRQVERKEMTVR